MKRLPFDENFGFVEFRERSLFSEKTPEKNRSNFCGKSTPQKVLTDSVKSKTSIAMPTTH